MVSYILYGLFILACLTLVLAVLLQPGKAGAGDLFTSSVSSNAFGPRGTQTLLAKITIGAAVAFMLVALLISLGVGSRRSVMSSADTAPAQPQTTPQAAMTPLPQTDAPTNSNSGINPGREAAPAQSPAPADANASPNANAAGGATQGNNNQSNNQNNNQGNNKQGNK